MVRSAVYVYPQVTSHALRRMTIMQRIARFALILGLGLFCLVPARLEAAQETPSDVVRYFYDELLDTMKNAAKLGSKGRFEKLQPVVHKVFDLPFMTRMSVGSAWARLTPEQKQRAWNAFGRYIA